MIIPLWFARKDSDNDAQSPSARRARGRVLVLVPDTQLHDDAEPALIERMRAGEHAAFEEVIRRYYAELLGYATSLVRSPSAADDLMQELFLRLWSMRESLGVTRGLRAYLYAAVRHRAFNAQRSARRSSATIERWRRDELDAIAFSPLELVLSDEGDSDRAALLARVRAGIDQLPARAREAWHLHHDRGLTYLEVAQVMGVSVGTIKSQMARAITLLRAALEPLLVVLMILGQ
jgi:RNA polymerase sigma-70 factor, ECF subfamily